MLVGKGGGTRWKDEGEGQRGRKKGRKTKTRKEWER